MHVADTTPSPEDIVWGVVSLMTAVPTELTGDGAGEGVVLIE